MKSGFLTTVLLAISMLAFSQDYMDDIAAKTCECLETVSDTLKIERFNMEIGLCIINAATPYKKELKKEYKIDLNKIDAQGEELGAIVGLRLVSICPDALMKMAEKVNVQEVEEMSEIYIEGEITRIEENIFVEFSLKSNLGRISKFHWLTFVESNVEISRDYKKLVNERVRIAFITQELFDVRIGEYRSFNIIQNLEKLKK